MDDMVPADGWVDVHAHFTPPITEHERTARWEAMRAQCFLAPRPHHWSPRSALDHMDRTGIAMQMLSNIPSTLAELRDSNDYGAQVVAEHPSRFGLLAALPTDDPEAALAEIERAGSDLHADGYAVSAAYNGVYLGDERLEPVWAELDRRRAVVFAHPNAYAPAVLGHPVPLVEVAFETARSVVNMLYAGVFRRYPHLTLVLAHAGGALPALSGRLRLLGAEPWVPNPHGITRDEIRRHLGRLYLDTAASGADSHLAPALTMVPRDHLVYGADCGVPCSTDATMAANIEALRHSGVLTGDEADRLGRRALDLFPAARRRRGH
ncbi:amidohydrolase family protein [Streptomyces luomodiensis]|uniref:6-methylsalicylate decarboxylase n=1 Tax=Streptomyces luomodiensis TaxID=3026192 RepID=A0ABY9V1P4_9ACTN|nr:amidohydrolase family protein [Streptomyces sp. SCA4-21]WNE98777.1 amidohydrolase family protein [Streptomyces sp. SCA4-21]